MKKITLLFMSVIGLNSFAQDNPASIQAKIAELNQQKASLDAEIAKFQGMLPAPVIPTWSFKGNGAINFGQTLLGQWAAGGTSNLNLQAVGHVEANMLKGRHTWNNSFDGRIGFIKNFDPIRDTSDPIQKNADLLQITSSYMYDLKAANLKVGVNANFLSQFTKTYDATTPSKLISDFLAPGTLDLSPGALWTPLPYLTVYFSPAMARFTFVTNQTLSSRAEGAFGNLKDQTVRTEVGAKADITFEKEVVKNLVIRSRAQLFNAWARPQADLTRINSQRYNVDVNWQTDLFYKLTKNIAVNFGVQALFDDDIKFPTTKNPDPGKTVKSIWQLRQSFGVGFVYGF